MTHQCEVWDIAYRWSYGRFGKQWLAAAGEGRIIGFRVAGSDEIFVPPRVPILRPDSQPTTVDLGPGGTIEMITRVPNGRVIAFISLDGARASLFTSVREGKDRLTVGSRVRFVRPAAPVCSIADIEFEPA